MQWEHVCRLGQYCLVIDAIYVANTNKIIEIENILSPAFVRRRADIEDVETELNSYGGG